MSTEIKSAREALRASNRWIARLLEGGNDVSDVNMILAKLKNCMDANKAALALPRLNCEVGTPEEQAQRFDSFCVSHYTPPNKDGVVPDGCDCPCYVRGKGCNVFIWEQMPYEAEEGENDGSK